MPCSFCMSTNQFVMIVHVYMLRHWCISAGVFVQISNEKFLKFYTKYLRGSWFWFDWATCMAWCPAFEWLSCKKCWDASRMFYYWAELWCRWVISLSYFFFPSFFFLNSYLCFIIYWFWETKLLQTSWIYILVWNQSIANKTRTMPLVDFLDKSNWERLCN